MAPQIPDSTFLAQAPELELLVRFRRDLHRIPELDFALPRTIAYVKGVLDQLGCVVEEPCESCVCGWFAPLDEAGGGAAAGSAPEPSAPIAIRADMDALPITEATWVSFSSGHAGHMHACGHDAHMAMALTAAVLLSRARKGAQGSAALSGPACARGVLFVFQPAEETTGGAKTVCESGVFERHGVEGIFGFHVWPDLPAGTVASKAGGLLARSSETHIDIFGESTHIAKTYGVDDAHSRDAMLAAARFIARERELMQRLGETEPCICKFGELRAGTVCNAVAGEAHIAGSLRVFSEEMFDRARAEIESLLRECCEECGCTYRIHFADGYPPVVNDAALFERAVGVLGLAAEGDAGAAGATVAAGDSTATAPRITLVEEPLLIAEDFAFYQKHLPGVFFLLGVGEPGAGAARIQPSPDVCPYATSALHTETLMFDERNLLPGVAFYLRLIAEV